MSVGGVSQVVENLIKQMKIHGKYVPLLMVNSWQDTRLRAEEINDHIHYFYRFRTFWQSPNSLKNILVYFLLLPTELYQFYRFLKKEGVTVINVHYCGLYALNISILKVLGFFQGTLILSFHGKDFLAAKQTRGIEKVLWKLLLRSTDKITTCSESLKQDVATLDRGCPARIIAIHNGIDPSFGDRKSDGRLCSDNELTDKKFILNVASFDPVKGQEFLIQAFSKIASDFPEIRLIMIGRKGETKKKLENLVHSLGLQKRILFYDELPHDRLPGFY
jgi:glycosyltransferase involved in cell wall biosynthesis